MRKSSLLTMASTAPWRRFASVKTLQPRLSLLSSMPESDFSNQALALLDKAVESMGGQRRDGQHEMVRRVVAAIESGDHLLVQAGTGTGKSLAYLIPLIVNALTSDKPAVVATAT